LLAADEITDRRNVTGTLLQSIAQRRQARPACPQGRFRGRGIVTCAGGPRYFTCAWVLIWILRRVHRVDLPIQVWHLGRREMSEEMRLLLTELDAEVVDAETVIARHPARVAGGWPLKPYAIAHSRFREVLYLDADTVPLVDPRRMLDWEAYRRQGMLLWPDVVDLKADGPIWQRLGLAPRDCVSVDSAVMVFDKQRTWDVLDMAVLLNAHVEQIYDAVHGDKDTFLLSALLLERDLSLMPHRPFDFDNDRVHRDPAGDPFLHHRTSAKWSLTTPNRPLAGAVLMPHAEAALAELRRRWSGVVFHLPERSARARAEEHRLAGIRCFLYEPWSTPPRRLELLPGGRVGEGRDYCEQFWAVAERDGQMVLQLFSVSSVAVELARCADGAWHGRSLIGDGFSARLTPETAAISRRGGEAHTRRSAAEWVSELIDPSLLAAGYDPQQAYAVAAALSLINDRFDDVPEEIEARLDQLAAADEWRRDLHALCARLASLRDRRIALARAAAYPQDVDPRCYSSPLW
jgi:hypothetical protein